MTSIHLDFETYSKCDLKARGLDNYAKDPSTGAHCLAFAVDDGPTYVCAERYLVSDPWIKLMLDEVRKGATVYAHNAPFELAIWNNICVPKYGWPELKPEQCRCTMAMAYAMGLPGKLEAAAPALGIAQRKDMAGSRVMMQLATPKKDGTLWRYEDAPEKFQQLYDYCKQDVEVERALSARLIPLSPGEQKLWTLDFEVNQRGILVEVPAVKQAVSLVGAEQRRLDQSMLRCTSGTVGACSEVQLLVKWIRSQGVPIKGVAKAVVLDTLEGELPPQVRQALELRKEAAKSSTAKLQAMLDRASSDGRVRNMHQFHGANTGRWAGRGIQPQNFTRPRAGIKPKDVETIIHNLDNRAFLDLFYGPVLDALADALRGFLIAGKGKDLLACDFSAIEARVLAWLAGQESVLQVFRAHGKIYEHTAAAIYRKRMEDVTKEERQIGKVSVLALGYGGGVGAFQSMAKNYFVKVPDGQAEEIKVAWREAHPKIVSYWYALEGAAIDAVLTGRVCKAGAPGREVAFRKAGSFLWCKLPSGRVLCYPYPEIRAVETPWGEMKDALTYMTVLSDTKGKVLPDPAAAGSWQRISTYGGSLAENVTQAVARDLLADAMVRMEDQGADIVMHVHDEVVLEIPEETPASALGRVEALMSVAPAWAVGLPMSAEGWRGKRYRK